MTEEVSTIDIHAIKDMSAAEINKLKKSELLNAILNIGDADLATLNESIKELSKIVREFKAEVVQNSAKIVELVAVLQDNIKKLQNEILVITDRLNGREQRSRIENVEIAGLKYQKESETDETLFVNFFNDVLGMKITSKGIGAVHEVPTQRKDKVRVVIAVFASGKHKKEIPSKEVKEKQREYNRIEGDKILLYEQLSPTNRKNYAM